MFTSAFCLNTSNLLTPFRFEGFLFRYTCRKDLQKDLPTDCTKFDIDTGSSNAAGLQPVPMASEVALQTEMAPRDSGGGGGLQTLKRTTLLFVVRKQEKCHSRH